MARRWRKSDSHLSWPKDHVSLRGILLPEFRGHVPKGELGKRDDSIVTIAHCETPIGGCKSRQNIAGSVEIEQFQLDSRGNSYRKSANEGGPNRGKVLN